MKTVTIFDNMDMENYLEVEREFLRDSSEDDGMEYSEDDVWELALEAATDDWCNVKQELANLCPYGVLGYGTFGGWQGDGLGGFVVSTLDEALDIIIEACDYWKVEEVGRGHLIVTANHHDGRNRIELFAMTQEAMERYEAWENHSYQPWERYNEQGLHEMMIRNHHARIMNYTKKVW